MCIRDRYYDGRGYAEGPQPYHGGGGSHYYNGGGGSHYYNGGGEHAYSPHYYDHGGEYEHDSYEYDEHRYGVKLECAETGTCSASGTCECDDGFTGGRCSEPRCPVHWSAEECGCCASGVLSVAGECCPAGPAGVRPVLDREGRCCPEGRLDACGVCGGQSLAVDMRGECCPVRSCCSLCLFRRVDA